MSTTLVDELFDAPLYKAFQLPSDGASSAIKSLRLGHTPRIDRYCPACKASTTWTITPSDSDKREASLESAVVVGGHGPGPKPRNWADDFTLRFFCAREHMHQCTLFFNVEGPPIKLVLENKMAKKEEQKPLPPTVVMKIGQYPSLSDIQLGTLKEYEEGMSVQQRKEFVRAINTSAHGFNVAACVHYRRVFESVLFEARDAMMKDTGRADWPEFDRLRTDEKIAEVRAYLPQFMVDHPHLYSILSKGVHELTEEECGEAMPTLRQSIELMLQDKVDAIRREKRRQSASAMLARTVDKHK